MLSLACNILSGGTCIKDPKLRRTDEAFLDAMGAQRIPDPTTAGDFCRRFENEPQILTLMEAINQARLKVWKQQEPGLFTQAIVDADGTGRDESWRHRAASRRSILRLHRASFWCVLWFTRNASVRVKVSNPTDAFHRGM